MRFALTLLVLLLLPVTATAQDKIAVEFSESEVLSLYYFARAALGDAHKNPRLREIWEDHADDEDKAALKRVEAAIDAGPRSFRFYPNVKERPDARHAGSSFDNMLEGFAGEARSIDDFGARLSGALPVEQQAELVDSLRVIAPLHQEHVWKPSRKFAPEAARDLRAGAKKFEFERRFAQVAKFYGARWPASVPIRIYLVPVPGKIQRTNAHSAGPIEVVEVVENDDIESRLAVIFHELCHSLYKAQPLDLQVALERAWNAHPLPNAAVAYTQVNEGIATALGNGWVEIAMRGDVVHKESWYADRIVDGFSKQIYPLVKHYLDTGRTMDAQFVNYAVALFNYRFPDAHREPRVVYQRGFLGVGEGFRVNPIIKAMQRSLRTTSLWSGYPLDDEGTLKNYAKRLPTMLVVSPDGAGLHAYPASLSAKLAENFASSPTWIAVHDIDSVWHVVIGAPDNERVTAAVEALGELDVLTDGAFIPVP